MSDDRDSRRTGGEREGFASRWARRKREAGRESPEKAPAAPTPAAPAAEDPRSDEEILRELGLPPPESLTPDDDFSPFMGAGVPARLRNRALRRLWGAKPALANLDGLLDYGGDFTDAATVPALFKTAYKVGRGWMEDEDKAKPEATPPEPAPTESEPEAVASKPPQDAPPQPAAAPSAEAEGAGPDDSELASATEVPERHAEAESATVPRPTPRRRMRFRFADG